MKTLVTGATGFLGRHLVAALLAAGHDVRMLGRDFSGSSDLIVAGAQPHAADLRDLAATIAACDSVEVVFHVGALSAPWGRAADFQAINIGGTMAVIEGCRRFGARRLVYVSSPSVVFDGVDQWDITEDAPYPTHFISEYSRTKKRGEDLVSDAPRGLETVILRPKAMFGPGDRALLPRLIAVARAGRLPQIGDGRNLVDLTYVENVVDALLLAMERPEVIGGVYHITNDEHVALWETIRGVLRALDLSDTLRAIPLPIALAAAALMEATSVVTGKEPTLTRYSVQILARTQTYDISAAKRDLGYCPRVSIAEGIERTLEALRRAPAGDLAATFGA